MLKSTFEIDGLPEMAARLDKIAVMIAGPISKEAVRAGGELIQDAATANVHKLTGLLASEIIVKVVQQSSQTYALIGPAWDPDQYRRVTKNRGARNREVHADQTTNPGVYGYFLEVGHRAPSRGLAHNPEYRRAQSALRKRGRALNTYTQPSSHEYGELSTPAYPYLGPAVESEKDAALAAAAEVIESRLAEQGI